MINFNQKYIEYDRIYIKIEIVDSDSALESESDSNRRSNSDRDFDLTTTIPFGTSNRISLHCKGSKIYLEAFIIGHFN